MPGEKTRGRKQQVGEQRESSGQGPGQEAQDRDLDRNEDGGVSSGFQLRSKDLDTLKKLGGRWRAGDSHCFSSC